MDRDHGRGVPGVAVGRPGRAGRERGGRRVCCRRPGDRQCSERCQRHEGEETACVHDLHDLACIPLERDTRKSRLPLASASAASPRPPSSSGPPSTVAAATTVGPRFAFCFVLFVAAVRPAATFVFSFFGCVRVRGVDTAGLGSVAGVELTEGLDTVAVPPELVGAGCCVIGSVVGREGCSARNGSGSGELLAAGCGSGAAPVAATPASTGMATTESRAIASATGQRPPRAAHPQTGTPSRRSARRRSLPNLALTSRPQLGSSVALEATPRRRDRQPHDRRPCQTGRRSFVAVSVT